MFVFWLCGLKTRDNGNVKYITLNKENKEEKSLTEDPAQSQNFNKTDKNLTDSGRAIEVNELEYVNSSLKKGQEIRL